MKKTKLTLEKFKVSKLTNLSVIKGGGDTATTSDNEGGPRCKGMSMIILDDEDWGL